MNESPISCHVQVYCRCVHFKSESFVIVELIMEKVSIVKTVSLCLFCLTFIQPQFTQLKKIFNLLLLIGCARNSVIPI